MLQKNINDIKPYEKNPRNNDNAVQYVANSIKEFGFKVPIVIDKGGVIVAGHTRYKAAQQLGMTEVPCVVADDLTEEQVKAYRLADNKAAEASEWDFGLLNDELDKILNIDMSDFGFLKMDNDKDMIDDLLENSFTDIGREAQEFDVTFTFPIEAKENVDYYIGKNGKEKIVEDIINKAEGFKDA